MSEIDLKKALDYSAYNPHEAALTSAAVAIKRGLHPTKLIVTPGTLSHITMSLRYSHEYIDEEGCSYLVLRTPERLLVCHDRLLKEGIGMLICRNPDVEIEVWFAT